MKKTKVWISVILGAFAMVALFAGSDLGVPNGRNAPIPPPAGYDLSASGNLIASMPLNDKFVVYGYNGNSYQLYSTIEPESGRHFDVGDVDNDSLSEIAVCDFKAVSSKKNAPYQVCLKVYKEGFSGVWKSCCSSVTTTYAASNQVLIADVDNDSFKEILMVTVYNLVIFKYSSATQGFTVLSSISNLKDNQGLSLNLQSVGVAPQDVNGDGFKEIYVSTIIPGNVDPTLRGYLLIFPDYNLNTFSFLPPDRWFANGGLRIGDVNGDGQFEICSPSCDYIGNNLYRKSLCVWNGSGILMASIDIPGTESSTSGFFGLDVGELSADYQGEEVAISGGPGLSIYTIDWANNNALILISQETEKYGHICIRDSNGDGMNEVNVGGAVKVRKEWGCYLAVFDARLNLIWEHIGSPRNEGDISDFAVAK
jgi:hypothetical protein